MSGIYIHIPFCKQACSYCDFYFVTRTSEREHFVKQLLQEIREYGDSKFAEPTVQTIYFGGGTPSLLEPNQIEKILGMLDEVFGLDPQEITFEMNPDDVSKEFLADLKGIGISRASMGVQSFDEDLLEFMNRAHSRKEAFQSLELLHASEFESFTIDLIYGNPGQTTQQLEKDVEQLLQFNSPHISAYSLTIEPNTRLGKQVELGRIAPPEDDKVIEHFELLNHKLEPTNIERYEVSNYSKPGCEAVHNSNYWCHENYLGLGPGAHSFWWDDQAERWENESNLRAYLQNEDQQPAEQLTLKQLAEERLMMGLRTREGVARDELSQKYDYKFSDGQLEYLNERQDEGKIELNDEVRLTDRGITIADAIILDLVTLH